MTKVIFIDAEYTGEILLSKETISYIKKNKINSVALFASAQFLNFEKIIKQLSEINIKVVLNKVKRTERVGQILGCNIYKDNFEEEVFEQVDAVLYIGDGQFHPSALLFAGAGVKNLIVYNPISKKMKVLSQKDIERNLKKIEINKKRFLLAKTIGIFVTLKPGQEHLRLACDLKKKLELNNKKSYIFVGNEFNTLELENFNFINAWVNSACPRIATDDLIESDNVNKAVINIKDAFELVE